MISMFHRIMGVACAAALAFGACGGTEEVPDIPASTACPAPDASGPPVLEILSPKDGAKVAAGESVQVCLDVGGAVLQGPGKQQGKPDPRAYRLTMQINDAPPTVMTGTIAALIATSAPGGDEMTVTFRLEPLGAKGSNASGKTLKDSLKLRVETS